MKKLIAVAALAIVLSGCAATTKPIQPDYTYYEVPVASWPEPMIHEIPKLAGIEYITKDSTPGEVVGMWEYEAEYWKSQSKIYRTELELYKHKNYNLKSLEEVIREVNDSVKRK